jgi:phosphoglycerol transferase
MQNNKNINLKLVLSILALIYLVGLYFVISDKVKGDSMKPIYQASLADGIDFKRPGYPDFLKSVIGMSTIETWGRWTDSNESDAPATTRFIFKNPLPKKFTLQLEAQAFGPNIEQPILVKIGNEKESFSLKDSKLNVVALNFSNTNESNIIDIVIPKPTSPKQLNVKSDDTRKLGIGLATLKIIE